MVDTYTIPKKVLDDEFARVAEEYFTQYPDRDEKDFARDTVQHFIDFLQRYGTKETKQ